MPRVCAQYTQSQVNESSCLRFVAFSFIVKKETEETRAKHGAEYTTQSSCIKWQKNKRYDYFIG